MARFCFIWIIMLGSMIAVRDSSHFDLDVLPKPDDQPWGGVSAADHPPLMMIMALTFIYFGYGFALFGLDQESELTGLNMVAIHIAWPLAGFGYVLVPWRENLGRYRPLPDARSWARLKSL